MRTQAGSDKLGVPRVNDRRICRTLSGNKRCCIMTRVPCLAVVPCWPDGRAFLQGKQQGKIRFAIAPMVARCASCSEHRVALPYTPSSAFSRINLEQMPLCQAECCPNETDRCSGQLSSWSVELACILPVKCAYRSISEPLRE
jgi:hypothetical protein